MQLGDGSPKKQATGRCRRLTIEEGDHPCAENRPSRLSTSEDTSSVRPDSGRSMDSKALEAYGSMYSNNSYGQRPYSGYVHTSRNGSRRNSYHNSRSNLRPHSVHRDRPFSHHSNREASSANNNNNNTRTCQHGCNDTEDGGGISYLSVPSTPFRRPSTADVMIEKLNVST